MFDSWSVLLFLQSSASKSEKYFLDPVYYIKPTKDAKMVIYFGASEMVLLMIEIIFLG